MNSIYCPGERYISFLQSLSEAFEVFQDELVNFDKVIISRMDMQYNWNFFNRIQFMNLIFKSNQTFITHPTIYSTKKHFTSFTGSWFDDRLFGYNSKEINSSLFQKNKLYEHLKEMIDLELPLFPEIALSLFFHKHGITVCTPKKYYDGYFVNRSKHRYEHKTGPQLSSFIFIDEKISMIIKDKNLSDQQKSNICSLFLNNKDRFTILKKIGLNLYESLEKIGYFKFKEF